MENPEKKIFKAAIVNTDELVKAQARDIADARMTESKEDRSGNFLARMGRRIWKHNLAQEWYRQREISRAKKDILESDNLYVGEKDFDPDTSSANASKEAMQAIVSRFTSEYDQEMLKKKSENRETSSKKILPMKVSRSLLNNMQEATCLLRHLKNIKNVSFLYMTKTMLLEKSMYADNLLEIANQVKGSVLQGTKLAELDFDIDLTRANAKESLSTQAHLSGFDKGMEKLQNSKVGKYIANEPIAMGITAGLWEVGRNIIHKTARGLGMGSLIGGTFVAGTLSAAKERARVIRERAQHQRESAKGMQFTGEKMKRREEMEKNKVTTLARQP